MLFFIFLGIFLASLVVIVESQNRPALVPIGLVGMLASFVATMWLLLAARQ